MAKINYSDARFEAAFGTAEQLPEAARPEVAIVGRSNVGKSSLLNRLVGRKALAKVSAKPGKTATINFYDVDGIYLVDLPGYGYAAVSGSEKQRWADLIAGYFDQERSFNLVISLIDIRHEPSALDRDMVTFLQEGGYPLQIVLTKADKLSRSQQGRQRSLIAKELGMEPSDLLISSSATGAGIDEIKAAIAKATL
ncbi:MAG: YihA family ribosome biogenesis GTP-binding protein [Atopobiaceae bacterium]|jgi:GTP-binding protein|uniref:Probable GTP-binding protein EngB n=1 Tax=Muricaecibacterium torontonense TaxID=3032871 RepID=A0A4S2F0L3_9ACTN|nr:ribosome biogenesis GTP-binding protein YihA/YsxC [Muricaecibacterium torontonense]MCI8676505.1 YihA family ribosome biogenesis GTP-binding protein [Atopobiaceae bacterium]TGY61822.1 YihA family ribosome biogenesis GTP-binding protein [Muricaecibacterium torontonense]